MSPSLRGNTEAPGIMIFFMPIWIGMRQQSQQDELL